ncbi:MAG: DUF1203 domain-containing protein [Acidimicrobiales bacterium]|jgi:hypothetical protein
MTLSTARALLAFQLHPMPAPLLAARGVAVEVDAADSYPCRRCLRDGRVGETMTLVSYDPFLGRSPYTGPGPIFVHSRDCELAGATAVPEQLRRRLLAVRAYDAAHFMVDCDVVDGCALETVAARFFADPQVSYAHVHFARAGCFAVRLDRLA